ncbi:MAG: preprotein translocase subunit SecE [Desulfobacula sp.]|nr:preprotein translocase subunit SecE [Desulfobacula sp.]
MSRLQKKKPHGEKKRRSTSKELDNDSTGSSGSSNSKPATVTSSKKAILEKNSTDVASGEPNVFQKAVEFVREVKVELKKVTWPTRKQTTGTTIVVIIFVFVVSAFLGLFDLGLSKLVQVVLT